MPFSKFVKGGALPPTAQDVRQIGADRIGHLRERDGHITGHLQYGATAF
jgi:hypothetical protein